MSRNLVWPVKSFRSVTNVIGGILLIFFLSGSYVSAGSYGFLMSSDRDRKEGYENYIFVYNSLAAIDTCLNEIVRTGARGSKCEDLSFGVKEGTKVYKRADSGRYRYIIIQEGPYSGKKGYVFSECYGSIE